MNVNLHIQGELEIFINRLVKEGFAANKTEAIRLAIVRYYEEKKRLGAEAEDQAFYQHMLEEAWNNPKDEKASEFYKKRYLRGKD